MFRKKPSIKPVEKPTVDLKPKILELVAEAKNTSDRLIEELKTSNPKFRISPAVLLDSRICAERAGYFFVEESRVRLAQLIPDPRYYCGTLKPLDYYLEELENYDPSVTLIWDVIGPKNPFPNLEEAQTWLNLYKNDPDVRIYVY